MISSLTSPWTQVSVHKRKANYRGCHQFVFTDLTTSFNVSQKQLQRSVNAFTPQPSHYCTAQYLQHEVLFPAWLVTSHCYCCALHILHFQGHIGIEFIWGTRGKKLPSSVYHFITQAQHFKVFNPYTASWGEKPEGLELDPWGHFQLNPHCDTTQQHEGIGPILWTVQS